MRKLRMVMGSLVGAALLAGSIAPAQARDGRGWDRGGWGHRHYRGDGFGFGDAVGVAALIGAVAIVANSMSKDKAEARDRASAPPPPVDDRGYQPSDRMDDRSGDSGYDARDGDHAPADGGYDAGVADARNAPASGDLAHEDSAVDACAVAARDRAAEQGGYAEIREIGSPQATDDGFNIDGRVERRASYRDTGGETRRFTCTVKGGRVADVYLSRDVALN
ncbi:hypothetical protein [Sphingobium aquiterrae]|uniref:hypothetical protein n=1 Tax=Sphingobium aquiterrae TaxID=2038656 RepID=UPI00301AA626